MARTRPLRTGFVAATVLLGLAGCAPTGVPVSPDLGAANLPHATELVTAAVTAPGLRQAGLRISTGCGGSGDGPLFSHDAPEEYRCIVYATAAYALPGIEGARAALAAAETALIDAGCATTDPASTTLSEAELSRLASDPDAPDVQEGWLCGTQGVEIHFGRADSPGLQDTAARLHPGGAGASPREDPPLDLAAATAALDARDGVTSRFVVVAFSWLDYLRMHACGMRACDTHGEPVVPDTSFPTPQP
jgi:hypothetical protein